MDVIGLTEEMKLRFQVSLVYCGQSLMTGSLLNNEILKQRKTQRNES